MDKDRFGALMRLAEFRNARIADRRSHEWKVTVALWALLAAAILKLRISPTPCALSLFAVGLAGLVIGHAFWWVGNHWRRSFEDMLASFFYADRAHDLALPAENIQSLRGHPPQAWPKDIGYCRFLCQPRCQAQIFTTAALAIGLWLASALDLPPST
jgi:hypothetical protein